MKKYDVGIKEKEMYGETVPSTSSSKERIIRPSFSLTQKQLPILKGKEFDDHFTIEADVRIEAIRSTEDEKNSKVTYEIEILKVGLKSGKLSDDEFDKLSKGDKEKYMKKSVGLGND
ncbi:hypothetical protein KAW50_08355 [candidate division WOR-3 bacterium]|nr:hypothetical protein [candidate division WOR-3 bacterium]